MIKQNIRTAPYYNVSNADWEYIGLQFVPDKFKKRFIPPMLSWLDSLPVQYQGLPIGSPVSCLAAPLLLVPVWLDLRQQFGLPLLVYADDIMVFCKTQEECGRIFAWLNKRLHEDYALSLQIDKIRSGRFASTSLDYCGWNFKGGYSRISEKKVEAFKQRVTRFVRQSKGIFQRAFFKRLNRKIDGFGNYY